MKWLLRRGATGLVLTIVFGLSGRGAFAVSCFSDPAHPPICVAQAGDKVCSGDSSRQCVVNGDCVLGQTCVSSGLTTIGVTATPFSGTSITSVSISGSGNLVTIPGAVSGGLDQTVTFRVRQTTTTQDDLGTAVVHQSNGATCTVDMTFDFRASAGSTPQSICSLTGGYTLDVISTLPSPAGTTACSSHLGNCSESPNLPADYEFVSNDSRVLSVHSPITGPAVDMQLVRAGSFLSNLRLMYSRFNGSSFPTYDDITYAVVPGSTIIRGTGQWSDVKLVAADSLSGNSNNLVPTVGEWGLVIMTLLLLTAATVLLARHRLALASGPSSESGPALVRRGLLLKVSAGIGALGLLSFATAVRLGWTPNATDGIGSLVSAGILAYLLHYGIALTRDDGKGGPH
jgi:hypothetical protein